MAPKYLLLFALVSLVLIITSEVAAVESVQATDDATNNEVKGITGGGGYPGGGYPGGGYPGGGYPGGGGGYPGGGSHCHFGCCGRRTYTGYCLRCCGLAEVANNNNAQANDEVTDIAGYGGGGYPGWGYPGHSGYSGCHFGCCGRRTYNGYCLRCCGLQEVKNNGQVEIIPHN